MKSLCFVLLLALSSTACSRFTTQGRQERAYAKYLKKSSNSHDKQAKVRHSVPKMPPPEMTQPSEPRTTTQTSEAPQSVPSNPDNQ
jgi:hypothetical protein